MVTYLKLQQHLPFTVLKRISHQEGSNRYFVATAPTVYGIETHRSYSTSVLDHQSCNSTYRLRYWNWRVIRNWMPASLLVATVPTVYGIETIHYMQLLVTFHGFRCNSTYRLRYWNTTNLYVSGSYCKLQQYLPFTVLKLIIHLLLKFLDLRCNSTYRLRYWNVSKIWTTMNKPPCCNSTYRLRYWNW